LTDFSAIDSCCSWHPEDKGQKGVTMWGPSATPITLEKDGGSATIYFTFTQPRCYEGPTQVCNVTYKIHTETTATTDDVGPIQFKINGNSSSDRNRYHSKISGHDIIETVELVPYGLLNQTGTNNIEFINDDNYVDVEIQDLTIIRTYQMCWLYSDFTGECNGSGKCQTLNPIGTHPYEFAERRDYPCLCNGGSISWTDFGYNSEVRTIAPGETVSWSWTNPMEYYDNYVGPISCLINFNNVALNNSAAGDDVTFSLRLNSSDPNDWVTYYQSKRVERHQAPSVDLAQNPDFSSNYNDNPLYSNTLEFRLDSNTGASLILCDGCSGECPPSCEDGGRVNLYRVYQTEEATCCSNCQTPCEIECQTCQNCYTCQGCEETCEITCQTACETCESCYATCEDPCETCESCYATCETACDTACQVICEYCQTCYPCYICYTCMTCQSACELTCQTGCEVSCQTGCEVSCQTGCEVSCQTACDASCQDCQTCYPCFVCYSWYT